MFFDGIRLVEGAEVNTSAVNVGAEFPLGIPAIGELFYADGTGTPVEGLYVYTSIGWLINTDGYVSVNKAGDSMLGFLTLHANPSNAFHAATKQYVDTAAGSTVVTNITGPGFLNNALIAQTGVTQHQAALAIAETQITNGLILARVAENETITGTWTFSGLGQLNVPTPTASTHAANKEYVDLVATGLTVRSAVRVSTIAPLPTCTYNNGTLGVSATLTATANAALSIDGLPVSAGEAVLVKDQVNLAHNGVYTVQAAGADDPGGSLWILSRRVSSDTAAEIPGTFVFVNDGTLSGTGWVLEVANPNTFTVGTDAINVQQFSETGSIVIGGSDTHVQFNDGGILGGEADFTWNKTTNALNVAGTITAQPVSTTNAIVALATANNQVAVRVENTLGSSTLGVFNDGVSYLYSANALQLWPGAVNRGSISADGALSLTAISGTHTFSGAKTTLAATVTGYASLNLPHGTAPSSPANGDVWTTSTGLYARINGTTLGPIGSGLGAAAGSDTYVQFNDGGSLGADAEFVYDKTVNRLTVSAPAGAFFSGDFSNATVTNRTKFQSSTTNGNTLLTVVPNGTSVTSGAVFSNAATPTDSATIGLSVTGTASFITAGTLGTGTEVPLRVQTGATPVVAASFHPDGRVNFGTSTSYPDVTFNVQGTARFNTNVLVAATNTPAPSEANYFTIGFGSPGNGITGTTTPARTFLTANLYYGTAAWRHGETGVAGMISLYDRDFIFQNAPSATAGNAATLTTRFQWNNANTRFEVNGGIITNPSASGAEIINIVGGGGSGGTPGAAATLQGGASTGTGLGGAAGVVAGSSTGGIGGSVNITSGASTAASTGSGNITLTVGAPGAGGTGGQFQWVSNTTRVATLHSSGNFNIGSNTSDPAAKLAVEGLLLTDAPDVSEAGIRFPHGTAPSSPVNGDIWTTTGGLYARINGVTQGPFSSGGAVTPGGSDTYIQFNDGGGFGGDADFTWNKTSNALTLGAAGSRLLADFSAATLANRFAFQTTVTNDVTNISVIPNGTADSTALSLYSAAGFTASSAVQTVQLLPGTGALWDSTTVGGTGTGEPHRFRTTNSGTTSTKMSIFANGNVNIGTTTTDPTVLLRVEGATTITGGKLTAAATTAGYASVNLPHGTAPSSPVNGDVWTLTSGLYARINGTTVGPFATGAGAGFYWQSSAPGAPTVGDRWVDSDTSVEYTWVNDGVSTSWVALDNSFNNTSLDDLLNVNAPAPTNGQVLTFNTGAGEWQAAAATTPGGSNTQLQFNNSGAFGGDADLTWNSTTNALTIGGGGARILGDLTTATDANRLMFQTSTATSPTHLGVVPSTGGSASSFVAYAAPAAANSVITQIGVAGGISYVGANIVGSATYPALELRTGSSQTARLTINNAGNLTVAAPDSGTSLTVNSGSSSGEALLAVGHTSQHQGNFSVAGDARTRTLVLRQTTTNATPAELFLDGSALRMVLANDSTWHFDIVVAARRGDADDESAGYRFSGVIDRNTNAASTALVGSVTTSIDAEDTAAWDAAVSADTTNGALVITVTGEVSKTIRWVAFVRTVEIVA